LGAILDAFGMAGRALEPLSLLALADYLASIDESRGSVTKLEASFPILRAIAGTIASFQAEIAAVRRQIDPSGEIADEATPRLADIRGRLRAQRTRLRTTLESFVRNRDTAKYLQDQVVTDRHGRYVLVVRAEHRAAVPGVVHGTSASGASLYLEPIATVEINNDIVALEEEEAEEIQRILRTLTDAFRRRDDELHRTLTAATELDVIQACGRFSGIVGGIEPALAADGVIELRGARHPLLIHEVARRADDPDATAAGPPSPAPDPVPIDILLIPPVHVLVVTGPNTGGKTVALKTAGLLAAMAQAGLHIPAETGSRLPIFQSVFADIGDEQSISASLSTFSAHIANVVAMDRELELPALVLLDEVGAGTDPVEGGALGIAVIDHFRRRGAHVIATTHYDSLKSYASATEGVVSGAFGFDRETFAPTYRLVYGLPGRSLAIEIAARLGMPQSVIAAARENLTDPEKQLADHLARVDDDLRALEQERKVLARERAAAHAADQKLRAREDAVSEREEKLRRRFDAKLEQQLREARREIDAVVDSMKVRAAQLSDQAAVRLRAGGRIRAVGLSTGDTGATRADALVALDQIADRIRGDAVPAPAGVAAPAPDARIAVGSRVTIGRLGLEGVVLGVQGSHAEVDVRGKRLRTAIRDLRLLVDAAPPAKVHVSVDLQPRTGMLSELNVIGCAVEEALARLEKFLDESTVGDLRELRIVHGHGTGQLRRAVARFLTDHPLVQRFDIAPQNQGGAGVTLVELKD
jgi:DNA mismatch repair protein MutS2